MLTAQIRTELETQPTLQPGETGWWKVWGARAQDIRPGDIVVVSTAGVIDEFQVADPAPYGDGLKDLIRRRFRASTGELFSVGALQAMTLLRKGTRNTLADSI